MKTLLSLLTLLFTLTAYGQTSEEKEVGAAVEALKKALIDGKETDLNAIAAEELSYGHSSGKVEDKKTFVERLVSGDSDFKTIQLSEQTIRIVGNIAIVRHRLVAETNDNGRPGNPNLSVLLIWQNQSGKWRLLARQATKLPN
jgi:hypothetical protein